MILACVAKNGTCAWIIPNVIGQNRPKKNIYMFFLPFPSPWFWPVRLQYHCRLHTRTAYTWFWLVWPKTVLVHELFQSFWPEHTEKRTATCIFLHFHSNMILACASAIPVLAIYKNCLYMILACVAKNVTCASITPNLFGQNRPKKVELHVFSCLFPSRDSDLCVCYTSARYIQKLPIPDYGLCGQKRDLCINYSKTFWPE